MEIDSFIFFKSHKTFCQQWRLYSESVNLDEREEPLVFPAFLFIPYRNLSLENGTVSMVNAALINEKQHYFYSFK